MNTAAWNWLYPRLLRSRYYVAGIASLAALIGVPVYSWGQGGAAQGGINANTRFFPSQNEAISADNSGLILPNAATIDIGNPEPAAPSNTHESKVTINGQPAPVPEDGTVHQTISGNNSQTTVDITVDNSSTGVTTHSSSSSTNVNISSSQTTSTGGGSTTEINTSP
jgi:hypothetical protein